MRICIPTGTADATGEETRFQAKNRFFHSVVSFFSLGICRVFPLESRPDARKERCTGHPPGSRERLGSLPGAPKSACPKGAKGGRKACTPRKRRPEQECSTALLTNSVSLPETDRNMTPAVFTTSDLCDAHEEDTSGAFRVLPPVFRDFGAPGRFAGPVATVRAIEDNSRVREAVNSPGGGRVLVVEGGGSVRRALVGGTLAMAAAKNGWAGIVVDGAVRDAAELAAAGIGIKALALMPMRSVKRGEGQRELPVEIQGVPVRPGDWLYADADGIVVSATSLV